MSKELICECGDTESQHVDYCEQCVVPECGCKEFIMKEPDDTSGATEEVNGER